MGMLLITRFTLQEIVRRRLFLALLLLNLLFLAIYAFLLSAIVDSELSRVNSGSAQAVNIALYKLAGGIFTSVPTIWLVYLESGLLTILLTAGMISSEIEAGTFSIIVPKPLRRAEIVLGKWLGNAIIVMLYTAFLFVAFSTIIYWRTGYWPSQALGALSMLELAVLALLGITTLGSTLTSTIINGAVALSLFIGAPTISFAQLIILAFNNQPPQSGDAVQNVMTIVNLFIPTDALWHSASAYLLPETSLALMQNQQISGTAFQIPILTPQFLVPALFIWIIFYIIALPTIALLRFQKRDL